jgi:catechol 2,3-dioxygenase-like lactoylglutathione lyase family enzyme
MAALRLDHVNIRTARVAESIAFYGDALGLRIEPPPMSQDFSMGAYAYDENGIAIVHLIAANDEAESAKIVRGAAQFGMIDHFALRCDTLDTYVDRLTRSGIAFERLDIPQIGMHLLFVRDPNGVLVELGFPIETAQN